MIVKRNLLDHLSGCFRAVKQIRFSRFALDIYLPYARERKRSWVTDRSLIYNHLIPAFGDRSVASLCSSDLIQFQTCKLAAGYRSSSINRMTVLLKFMINCAMRWQYVSRNPTWDSEISELKNVQSRERFLTPAEGRRLLSILDQYPDPVVSKLFQLLLMTGGRKSELVFARWSQINWGSQTLTVPLSKSGATRYIYLSDVAISLLYELKALSGATYIFSYQESDRPITNLSRHWGKVRDQAELHDFRLHDLRHSFASFLIAEGRSLFEVQKLLGHAKTSTTMKYAHLANRQMILAANALMPSVVGTDEKLSPKL